MALEISDIHKLILEKHLQERLDNRRWVEGCLTGSSDAFPYRPVNKGKATMDCFKFVQRDPVNVFPEVSGEERRPLYMVNVPLVHFPGSDETRSFTQLVTLLRTESFGVSEAESVSEVSSRLAVVVGINQIHSIDPSRNRSFSEYIGGLPQITDIAYRVFGFFWYPKWKQCSEMVGRVYSITQAFLVLKALSCPDRNYARAVCDVVEGDTSLHPDIVSQVPYQSIRETILTSGETRHIVGHMERSTRHSPIYYVVMDGDAQGLRKVTGLFSRMDVLIQANNVPSAVTLGYSVSADERVLIRIGVEIDMAVRAATTSVIPFAAYLPEPCSGFRIREPERALKLGRLSFIGDGERLENRRLIHNGLAEGAFTRDAVFVADGGVTMGTPGRMYTKKNGKALRITPKVIKQMQSLETFRGLPQTHATPLKWAENVYAGLDFSCVQVSDAKSPLSHLFCVYDPIARMKSTLGRHTKAVFDQVMADYHNPLPAGLENLRTTARARLILLNMPTEMIDRVQLAAARSGEAIYSVLLKYSRE